MADDKQRGTIYQRLNGFFNFDGFGFAPTMTGQAAEEMPKLSSKVIVPKKSTEKG